MPLKQSVCISILPQDGISQETLIKEIAAIGFDAIEIWTRGDDFDSLCETASRHGVPVVSMIGHESIPSGLNDPSNHDRIESELRASIDVGVEKGLTGLICFSGNHLPGLDDAGGIENTANGLRRVAAYAEEKGVTLNLELLNSKRDHAGYQCDRTAWGLQVIEKVGSPRVKLLYDIYHMQIMEGDVIQTMTDNLQAIGHIHTAGNPGRHELNDLQELNYRGICKALADAGYQGHVGHEFNPKGDVISALRQAYETCRVDH